MKRCAQCKSLMSFDRIIICEKCEKQIKKQIDREKEYWKCGKKKHKISNKPK